LYTQLTPVVLAAAPIKASSTKTMRLASSFSKSERAIISEAQAILGSKEMAAINAAQQAGKSISVNVGGRFIQFEPGLPASGMTLFSENGFLIGREAFRSTAELQKTVLHELHRLNTSATRVSGSLSASQAATETRAAFNFAERAVNAL